jgi:hypothetical protein
LAKPIANTIAIRQARTWERRVRVYDMPVEEKTALTKVMSCQSSQPMKNVAMMKGGGGV